MRIANDMYHIRTHARKYEEPTPSALWRDTKRNYRNSVYFLEVYIILSLRQVYRQSPPSWSLMVIPALACTPWHP